MSKTIKYNDQLEKILTALFGAIATVAILINLHLKGYQTENLLDSVKDIAGLVVVIAVFLVANKLFKKGEKFDFAKIFEYHLKAWIKQNDYLVCENFDDEGKGKDKKRYCSMVIDHSNIVTRNKYAKDAIQKKEKGAFISLLYTNEGELRNEFEFRFNDRTFERQNIYKTEEGKVNLKAILERFASRIDDNFKDIGITEKVSSDKTITVSFENMEKTEENAKKLIDLVEFVKTMTLALA